MMKTERMGMLAVALILLTVVAVALFRSCPSQPPELLAPNPSLVDSVKADSIQTDTTKTDTIAPQKKPRRTRKKRPAPVQRPPRSHRDEIVN